MYFSAAGLWRYNVSESNENALRAPKPPRFIAGAVCPRCREMDRIVVSPDGETRSCVACDYSDARPEHKPAELPTRVTRGASRRVETRAEPVRLMESTTLGHVDSSELPPSSDPDS